MFEVVTCLRELFSRPYYTLSILDVYGSPRVGGDNLVDRNWSPSDYSDSNTVAAHR